MGGFQLLPKVWARPKTRHWAVSRVSYILTSVPQRTTRHFQPTTPMITATLILAALSLLTAIDESSAHSAE
jgi:hypothetical protein